MATLDEMRARMGVLYHAWAGKRASDILILPKAGSDRQYFRVGRPGPVVVGVYNPDQKENEAFVYFSGHFHSLGLPVPQVVAQDLSNGVYMQDDLGDVSLLSMVEKGRGSGPFPETVIPLYEETVKELARLQMLGHQGLDYGKCYSRPAFDRQSMAWDLAYFKYYFLKLARIPFDEQALEDDFNTLADYLCSAPVQGFMHRDFQARNIMVKDNKPYFIDFQGGRFGAVQYDLASLLFQAKAGIPENLREHLIAVYLKALSAFSPVDAALFREYFNGFTLIRTLQVLGAYGFRGLYEQRTHFLESIPAALDNLKWWMAEKRIPVAIPELRQAIQHLLVSPEVAQWGKKPAQATGLKVRVRSFSFKEGIPADESGNGGGFVFDCRGIHNPGRYPVYKRLTGRDQPVIDFLLAHSTVQDFLNHVFSLVDSTVEDYAKRGFSDLMVSFGCTGGQHRSVYCADQLAKRLQSRYGAQVELLHVVQERKNWVNEP